MSRISFSTLAGPEWSWTQTAEGAARYGYDGIEVRMVAGDTDLPARPEFAAGRRSDSRRIVTDLGLQICGLASSVRFDDPDATVRARRLDIGRRYIELAADLGAGFVRVFGDVLPEGTTPEIEGSVLGAIAEELNRLGEFAGQTAPTVRVVLETHGDFSETHLLSRLFERVVDPRVGILWDTHHPWRFHGESLLETSQRVASRTWHTHWKDSVTCPVSTHEVDPAAQEAADRARALMRGHRDDVSYALFGTGEFPARECLRTLLAWGYEGWYSLEWEKAWHPHLAGPDEALPGFPAAMRRLLQTASTQG
jgi:sugar phosphate isomerase/epimerase